MLDDLLLQEEQRELALDQGDNEGLNLLKLIDTVEAEQCGANRDRNVDTAASDSSDTVFTTDCFGRARLRDGVLEAHVAAGAQRTPIPKKLHWGYFPKDSERYGLFLRRLSAARRLLLDKGITPTYSDAHGKGQQ